MKIAITGHTAGIGQSFAQYLAARGHEIVGISRRDGNNIRNIPKIVEQILPCDLWINNAQSGYAQTELLYKIWERWQGDADKMIWIISTIMTRDPLVPEVPGQDFIAIAEYKNQKRALEDAFYQLKYKKGRPAMCLIRPGVVSTKPDAPGADVDQWVATVCEIYDNAVASGMWIDELNLGCRAGAHRL